MNNFRLSFTILTFSLLVLLTSNISSDRLLERIFSSFEKNLTEMPQEKVYIHVDRPYYAAGETIWFKSYLTLGPFHEPSLLSQTVYVELVNSDGKIIQDIKLYSPDGFASGHFDIPDSLSSGRYLIRSYTNWMRNFDEAYFFHRQIEIWNTELKEVSAIEGDLDVQFFPEGGDLVNGVLSKVAFKATGPDGLGKVVKGKILDGQTVIAEFESNWLGMGVFAMIPQKGKEYSATIEGLNQEFPLPRSKNSGIVMTVTNSPRSDDIIVKLQTPDNLEFDTVFLLAQTRGLICASSKLNLSEKVVYARIPKQEFPSGIAQITALDKEGNPLAERLVFIDHADQVKLTISIDKPTYAPRDSVRVHIHAKNKDGLPVLANLSLSAFDSDQVIQNENKENIKSNLLISSELKGYIEAPGYYFNPDNPDREEALDFLMMTQGWRRFQIKDLLKTEIRKPAFRAERGLTIRGKLTDKKDDKPIVSGIVSYLTLFPFTDSKTVRTATNGEFEINDLVYFDSTKVILEGKSKNGRNQASLKIDRAYQSPIISYNWAPSYSPSSEFEKYFVSKSIERNNIDLAFDLDDSEISLDGIEVQAQRIIEPYSGPRIYGEGSVKMKVAGNQALENLQHPLELIKGRVAGVMVWGSGQVYKVLIRGVGSINSGTDPLIMVDDMPIAIENLYTIPVMEIESYTVWKGPDTAIFGSRGANGVIGFYTKKGVSETPAFSSEKEILAPRGYHIEKEFYSPKYHLKDHNPLKPDRRVTLFWEPNIQTDSLGYASVMFYNHDLETLVQVEIEGLSISGAPAYSKFDYQISK